MDSQVKEITISVPADILLSANLDQEHMAQEMKEVFAYKLFSTGRLSSGKAAKLAGINRIAFLLKARRYNAEWLAYSSDEVRRELA